MMMKKERREENGKSLCCLRHKECRRVRVAIRDILPVPGSPSPELTAVAHSVISPSHLQLRYSSERVQYVCMYGKCAGCLHCYCTSFVYFHMLCHTAVLYMLDILYIPYRHPDTSPVMMDLHVTLVSLTLFSPLLILLSSSSSLLVSYPFYHVNSFLRVR
jgi:hypothetical protein